MKGFRRMKGTVSSSKLSSSLWRMQLPGPAGEGNIGFQSGVGDVVVPFHGHHSCKAHNSPSKDMGESPRSVSGPTTALLTKVEPSFKFPISAMEGATKWDPIDKKKIK
ncbi:hypothetical protein LIER_38930 [Lithospermum erythrorhizon]|uniref:Uncharacterized protein n=1 Tax=Lithospermum erythrorhizon TaxID=34254 RepID=A0AAV3Q9H8_LITER